MSMSIVTRASLALCQGQGLRLQGMRCVARGSAGIDPISQQTGGRETRDIAGEGLRRESEGKAARAPRIVPNRCIGGEGRCEVEKTAPVTAPARRRRERSGLNENSELACRHGRWCAPGGTEDEGTKRMRIKMRCSCT